MTRQSDGRTWGNVSMNIEESPQTANRYHALPKARFTSAMRFSSRL
jgi:hypothetical protein